MAAAALLGEQQSKELNDHMDASIPKEIVDYVCLAVEHILTASLTIAPSSECYISRVDARIRSLNKQAYAPNTVAIGPYYTIIRTKMPYQTMEDLKCHYLQSTLSGRSKEEVRNVVENISSLLESARQCYAQSTDDVPDQEFLRLMLLDSCFIVKIIRMFYYKEKEEMMENLKDDPFMRDETTRSSIRRDLLLFENQLPFFVLQRFYDLTMAKNENTPNSPSFINMALHFVSHAIPGACGDTQKTPSHLLSLFYDALVQTRPHNREGRLIGRFLLSPIRMIFSRIFNSLLLPFARPIPSPEREEPLLKFKLVNCSTDLAEKGVKFRMNEYGNCRLFDVVFADGYLIIPKLVVKSHSEAIFLNLLAHERHFVSDDKVVSDYMALMDCLIDSPKDVDLLCRCGIFENLSRDKGDITKLFDRPKDNFIVINQNKFVYREIFQRIDDHCRHPWTRFVVKLSGWMANLWDKYFESPWALISVLAATILLVVTVVQTVYARRRLEIVGPSEIERSSSSHRKVNVTFSSSDLPRPSSPVSGWLSFVTCSGPFNHLIFDDPTGVATPTLHARFMCNDSIYKDSHTQPSRSKSN
ncbi:Protein of unknown function DUF247, plant [Dillenia turbinata]|uniref:Uncharacterized protein n=1 Tax=Dillenia turbinata TaxID=194707 RepID=A0AAN8Z966_9MAGN